MTLYGIVSILVGISYFFGSFCPSVEELYDQIKSTSSSDGESSNEEKSLVKKSYEIAKGTGKSVLKLLNVGKEGFITSYIMFGTSRDEKGEINLWNWFEEAKKIHKGKKTETIYDDEDENSSNLVQEEKVTENSKITEENKSGGTKKATKRESSRNITIPNKDDTGQGITKES